MAASDEAAELLEAARGNQDLLSALLGRRLAGEPLAWVTGQTSFDGLKVRVDSGVYVPRWQSIELARRAAARLKDRGTAVDLCTGSGALAMALQRAHAEARVLATDLDARAVRCARANGVNAYQGDLFSPLPDDIVGAVDVIVAVAPYVPTPALVLLPRDTLDFEDAAHYDGGPLGIDVLRRVVRGGTAVPDRGRHPPARGRRRTSGADRGRSEAGRVHRHRVLGRRGRRPARGRSHAWSDVNHAWPDANGVWPDDNQAWSDATGEPLNASRRVAQQEG